MRKNLYYSNDAFKYGEALSPENMFLWKLQKWAESSFSNGGDKRDLWKDLKYWEKACRIAGFEVEKSIKQPVWERIA